MTVISSVTCIPTAKLIRQTLNLLFEYKFSILDGFQFHLDSVKFHLVLHSCILFLASVT